MAKFKKADKELKDIIEYAMQKWHQPLVEKKVRIEGMYAFGDRDENDNLVSDALTHGGYKATAVVRRLPLKDRVKGLADAEVVVDGDWWKDAPEEQKKAIIDHELQHLAVTDKVDDIGRPVLKLRKHDVQVGWFKSVAERHGASSMERIDAKAIFDQHGESFFPFLKQVEGSEGRIGKLEVHNRTSK